MAHDHSHHHSPILTNVNRAFRVGIALNFIFVVVETIAGLRIHSLSLLSDAGHNLADVAALALSLLAFKLLKVKSNQKYTYGYRKTSILVALFNAMLLLLSVGAIIYEAINRLLFPQIVVGTTIAWVAAVGIVINTLTALMFLRDKEKDLNIKSAYLHLMSDAIVSLGLVAGGIIIHFTNWYWIDSVLGILVALIILFSTWKLMRNSLRLSLDGVPPEISLNEIKTLALGVKGVLDFHHIHIWAISTTENALTAHLVLDEDIHLDGEFAIKQTLRHEFIHKNIQHITIETERRSTDCGEHACNAALAHSEDHHTDASTRGTPH